MGGSELGFQGRSGSGSGGLRCAIRANGARRRRGGGTRARVLSAKRGVEVTGEEGRGEARRGSRRKRGGRWPGWVGLGLGALCVFRGGEAFLACSFRCVCAVGWGREREGEGMTRANEEINRGFVF